MTVEIFNKEFEIIAGQLKSYLFRITASVADAEDIVQDTYIRALEKLITYVLCNDRSHRWNIYKAHEKEAETITNTK